MELERIDERLFVYGIRGDVVHLHVASRAGSVYSGGWKLLYERLSGRVCCYCGLLITICRYEIFLMIIPMLAIFREEEILFYDRQSDLLKPVYKI